ncbi:MAG: hypothetical protein FWC41_13955, partial [Firmicutes bacterium]|nr:hypothetical protein [Bacillota bacterium]
KTFSLEPGLAIDYFGREITIGRTYVSKLNLIKDFEKNRDKLNIYLCIKYKEVLDESTFSITSGNMEGEKQFNRIKEKFELFITDKQPCEFELKIDGLLFEKVKIYENEGVKIWGKFPKYANPKKRINIKIFIEKEKVEEPISFNFKVFGLFFEGNTVVNFEETEIKAYNKIERECLLECNADGPSVSEILITKDDFTLKIGENQFEIDDDIKIKIDIREENIKDILILEYYSLNFQELLENNEEKFIYLAKFRVITDGINYFIENFEKHPSRQYLINNDLLRLMHDLDKESQNLNYDNSNDVLEKIDREDNIKEQQPVDKIEKQITKNDRNVINNILTGVETINFGFKTKQGRVYYSYEFVHGLGPGNISVVTAALNKNDAELKENELLIFGDKSIFNKSTLNASIPNVTIAVVVNSEKGTMRIGVRLEERTTVQSIDVRWWVFRPSEDEKIDEDLIIDDNLEIFITPDSVNIKPLEQIRFEAKVKGTSDQRVVWLLGKDNPGKIDNNGLYKAPATEGVYEIIAKSANFEETRASAYIVVSSEDF